MRFVIIVQRTVAVKGTTRNAVSKENVLSLRGLLGKKTDSPDCEMQSGTV